MKFKRDNKKTIFVIFGIVSLLWIAIAYLLTDDTDCYVICLSNGCTITQSTDKLHSIHCPDESCFFVGDTERLIRGFVKGYSVYGDIVVGYLSTEFFNSLRIYGLEGKNDVDGYFIIDKYSRSVRSGLTLYELEAILQKEYGVNQVKSMKEVDYMSQFNCLLPPFLRKD